MNEIAIGVELLKKVRELISDEGRWTRYAFARNRRGIHTLASGEFATCWCVLGAIQRLYKNNTDYNSAHTLLLHECDGDIAMFNDTHTHAEIIAMLDRAIAKAEK